MRDPILSADALGAPWIDYRAGLVGADIGTSVSPVLHEREAAALGRSSRYGLLDLDRLGITAHDVGRLVAETRAAGWQGLNLTHPCKRVVVPFLDELAAPAGSIGAVNTVVFDGGRAIGHNTDASGFARGLRARLPGGLRPEDLADVVLVGAGGAGAAVGHALLGLGAAALRVADTDTARAAELAADLAARHRHRSIHPADPDDLDVLLPRASGLVNASPVGMVGHAGVPIPPGLLHPGLWVNDIVYRPRRTALLAAADELGCRTLGGGPMVVFQAAHGIELLTGLRPDPFRMLAEFDRLPAETPG